MFVAIKIYPSEEYLSQQKHRPSCVSVVASASAYLAVCRGFALGTGHTKDHNKMVLATSLLGTHALG